MSLGLALAAIWLVLTGLAQLSVVSVGAVIMGLLALAAGVLLLLEGFGVTSRRVG